MIIKHMNIAAISRKTWLTLLISIFIVLLSSAIREVFFSDLGRGIPYLTYYPAVMIAAIIGGLPSGLLATALSACLAYLWIQQGRMSSIEWLAMAFFVGICIMITLFANAMQRANARALKVDAIKDSEKRLRLIFENANETIVISQDEVVKYCNSQITQLSGYSIEEIYLMKFYDLIHPEDKKTVMREYKARLSGEKSKNRYSIRINTRDGKEKFVLVSSTIVNWESRPATLAMITDITQLKKVESELRKSEEHYRHLIENSPLPISTFTPDGKISQVNAAWKKQWGINEEETTQLKANYNFFTDKQVNDLGYAPLVEGAFRGELVNLPPIKYEGNRTIKDLELEGIIANTRWIQTHFYPVKDADGKIDYIVTINLDLTELKQAGELTLKSEERFFNLLESSPLGIAMYKPDGKIDLVNTAFMELWGLSEEEMAQVKANYNYFTDPQIKKHGLAPLVERAFKGESITMPPIEYEGNRTIEDIGLENIEAQTRTIQTHMHSVKNASGEIEYVVFINKDLTELRQAEKEAKQQRDILARIDRASIMGQLTGSIAHELNQPLTGILSNAQAAELILKSKNWNLEEVKEILAEIVGDTKRAGEIIRNLRALYSEQKVEFLPVEINTVIKETVKLLQNELVMQKVNLNTKCDTATPMVKGNKVQIQQVVVNLIMNGIQAMIDMDRNERNLWITTSCKANEVKVFVADNGKGINPEIIDNIFEPLATWKPDGTGMGLAICNSIIQAHGGRMIAENRPEGGACVGFVLPVIKEN